MLSVSNAGRVAPLRRIVLVALCYTSLYSCQARQLHAPLDSGAGVAQAQRAAHARSLRDITAQHPALARVSTSVQSATAAPPRQQTLGAAVGAPAPSWALLSTRASAAPPAARPAQQAPIYLPRTFVPCSLATHSAQGPKQSAASPARAAACADLPAQGPTPADHAGAASAPQPPQDVLQMAQRAGLHHGVFYDDRGRRWALGGGAPPVLLPQEPNPRPGSDPSAVPLAASADAAPRAPSNGVLAAVIVLGLAACGLGAVLAAWCFGVCNPNFACFCCCKGRAAQQPWMEKKVAAFHPPPPPPSFSLARLSQVSGMSRAGSGPPPSGPALARTSLNSDVARLVTVANDTPAPVQLLWVNYEGEPENLGCVEPGARRLLRTFATHVWRFRDARSNAAVTEFVVNYDTRSVHIGQDKQGALCASMTTGNGRPSALPASASEG